MADEAREFSKDEAQSLMFHGAPQQPMTAPAVQSASNIPVPPPVAVIPGAKKAPVAKEPDAMGLVQKVSKANKELQSSVEAPKPPSAIGGLVDDITANWKPIAVGALTGATAYGAARLLGGRKSAEASEGKPQSKGPAARIEPTFATPEETAAFKPVEQPTAPSKLALESEAKFGVPLSDVENHFGVKVTNIKDAEILSNNYKNSLPGAVSNAPAGIPSGVNPMNRLTNAVQPPVTPAAPPPAPSVGETVATGGNVAQAVKQTVADELDALTKPQQSMKNWLLNQYGGKDNPMAHEAYAQVKNILGYTPAYPEGSKGGSLAPEEKAKILDWRKQELPGPKVNLTHDMKKALRKGGPVAAALIATTEFANAKTAEDKANAGANLLGAMLPLGMDINAAGAPVLPPQQISNAALLGSPYAQTEWAKTQRLREKAGAGRGIAPPSAYR